MFQFVYTDQFISERMQIHIEKKTKKFIHVQCPWIKITTITIIIVFALISSLVGKPSET